MRRRGSMETSRSRRARKTTSVSSRRILMKTISSRQNALYKRLRRAIDEHADEVAIEGPKAVEDAIANGWKPIVVVHRDAEFSAALFDSLADTKTSQGVVALFERPHHRDVFDDDRII